jgi:hypothetical protein
VNVQKIRNSYIPSLKFLTKLPEQHQKSSLMFVKNDAKNRDGKTAIALTNDPIIRQNMQKVK